MPQPKMFWLMTIIILLLTSRNVTAQNSSTTGMVIGTVKDIQDSVVIGADVTIRQLDTNFEKSIKLKDDGFFQFIYLPPGKYKITAKAEGFTSVTQNITLNIGSIPVANFVLPLGQTKDFIEVNANPFLDIYKTEKSTVIDEQKINSLPIDRRNFLDFTLITNNVIQDRPPVQGTEANSTLSFNGQNARQNNVTIDGIDNNDFNSGSVRATYSQEAVKEFQVVSNSFSAEFGRASGGIVNIVTKRGANQPHASLFFFNRNDKLSARNAFSISKPPFSEYQFGATLAGAIKKDKAYFFTAFEKLSLSDSVNVAIAPETIASFKRLGFFDRSGDIPFSEANASFLVRSDIDLTSNQKLNLRYNYAGIYNGLFEPFGTLRPESIAGIGRIQDNNLSLSHSYISTSIGLVNDFRLLLAQRDVEASPIDPLGPKIALPTSQGSVSSGRAIFLPNPRQERIFQIANSSSLLSKNRQIKFGIDYLQVYLPAGKSMLPSLSGGAVNFSDLNFAALLNTPGLPNFTAIEAFDPTLRSLQQKVFLAILSTMLPQRIPNFPQLDLNKASLPTSYLQGFGNSSISTRYSYFSTFFQGDFSISQNIKLKLGLRYDLERIKLSPKNKGNFSPRIALSYRPRNSENLNFFAAYGIFHGITPFAPISTTISGKQSGYKILVLPFPFSIIPFSLPGHKFPSSDNLPSNVEFIPQLSLTPSIQSDLRNGYTQQINVGFNYLVNKNLLFSTNYQHVRGLKQFTQRDVNPVIRPIPNDPIGSRITGRIDPSQGSILEFGSIGDSYYNALSLELRYQLKSYFTISANYVFSKTLDNFLDYRPEFKNPQNPLNLKEELSYSTQDIRNRFVFSSIFFLGYGKSPFLNGFQLSTITTLESGRPYNLVAGLDLDMNADTNPGDRPLRMSRNLGILPGFASTNIRLTRNFKLKDKFLMEGFIETFNIFNRVNISTASVVAQIFPPNPDGTFNLPQQKNGRYIFPDGLRQASFNPRRLQIGFRLSF
jgi:hypothetical protein